MYPTGLIVATLFVTALAVAPQPRASTKTATPQLDVFVPLEPNDDGPQEISEFCFVGKYPSATCRFRCHLIIMEPYCDDSNPTGKTICMCRPATTPQPAPEESSQDLFTRPETHNEQEVVKGLLSYLKKAMNTEDSQQTSGEDKSGQYNRTFTIPMHTPVKEPEKDQNRLHVMFNVFALLIALLLVLISIELLALYKKQRAMSTDMETIFKNIPMPNKT